MSTVWLSRWYSKLIIQSEYLPAQYPSSKSLNGYSAGSPTHLPPNHMPSTYALPVPPRSSFTVAHSTFNPNSYTCPASPNLPIRYGPSSNVHPSHTLIGPSTHVLLRFEVSCYALDADSGDAMVGFQAVDYGRCCFRLVGRRWMAAVYAGTTSYTSGTGSGSSWAWTTSSRGGRGRSKRTRSSSPYSNDRQESTRSSSCYTPYSSRYRYHPITADQRLDQPCSTARSGSNTLSTGSSTTKDHNSTTLAYSSVVHYPRT